MTATATRRREMWGRGTCCSWRLENWRYNPGPGLIRHVIWCVLTLLGRSRKDGCQLLVYLFTLGIPWLFTFHTMRYEALIYLTVFASYNLFSDILSLHLCCWGKNCVFQLVLNLEPHRPIFNWGTPSRDILWKEKLQTYLSYEVT